MSDGDLLATITRVRRQTRNRDILDICDALERRLVAQADIRASVERGKVAAVTKAERKKARAK